jgi:phosphate transport system substrate-binding protein
LALKYAADASNDAEMLWRGLFLWTAGVSFAAGITSAAPIRLAGSTTVRGALEARLPELENSAACKLELSGNGSIVGLAALMAGSCDVAMLSMPLEDAVQALNQKTSGRVAAGDLHAEQIGTMRVLFVVNPHNPVRQLSATQLGDVLTGRIASWDQVGGRKQPITVVSLGTGGTLLDNLLRGAPIAPGSRFVANASQIAGLVAENPNAIGIISATHPRGRTTVLQTDANVSTPLFLVTRGQPNEAVARLVSTARAALSPP